MNLTDQDILNQCPICGKTLVVSELYQYERVFAITKTGRVSKKQSSKNDYGSMECSFISCIAGDFVTDADWEVTVPKNFHGYIIQKDGKLQLMRRD